MEENLSPIAIENTQRLAALSLAIAIGIVYGAGWFVLLVMSLFEDHIIPFFHKVFSAR